MENADDGLNTPLGMMKDSKMSDKESHLEYALTR